MSKTSSVSVSSVLKKIAKIIGWVFLSIVLLLVAIALLIQLPPIQNKITQKAISFLEQKIGTDVSLDHISISFPKKIVLKGLYLEDQQKDTLLYAGKLSIDTDLFGLLKNEINLDEISLKDTKAYISRPESDSAYNFTYILEAFAGDSTATPDTLEQKGWKIGIGSIELENIKASYHDLLTGNLADLNLGNFSVSVDEFDLENLKVVVDEINLSDISAKLAQTKQPEVTEEVAEEKQPITYDIGVGEVNLNNINIDFNQEAMGSSMRLNIDNSKLVTEKIDLKQQRIALKSFELNNSFIAIHQKPQQLTSPKSQVDPEPKIEKQAEENKEWAVTLESIDLNGNSFQYYDFTKPNNPGYVDFDHLWLTGFELDADNLAFEGSDISIDLNNLAFNEKSGFKIKSFRSKVNINDTSTEIKDLVLLTGNSKIDFNGEAKYPSLKTITKNTNQTVLNVNINKTHIGLRDILLLNPNVLDSLPINLNKGQSINIDAVAKGTLNNMTIDHFDVNALHETSLHLKGNIKGLPDPNQIFLNLTLNNLHTSSLDLKNILADSLLPKSLNLPEQITLAGYYKGSLKKSDFQTQLKTTIGNMAATGKMNMDSLSPEKGYKMNVAVNNFDLGELLNQQDTLGKFSMTAAIDTRGLTLDEMDGTFRALIESLTYKQYEYKNLILEGNIRQNIITANASLNDPNLEFNLASNVNMQEEVSRYNVTFDLKNSNFEALHLTDQPLKARGTLLTNIATNDFNTINGNIGLKKVAIFNQEKLYAVDSLLFASIDETGRSELTIESDLLSGKFEGSFNITKLPDALRQYFSTYYNLHDTVSNKNESNQRQYFKFNLKLKKTELLTDILVPELNAFVPGDIHGEFDSEAKQLDMRIDFKQIQYANIGVKDFIISTNSDARVLNYNFVADEIRVDSMKIDGFEFNGTVANDTIDTNIVFLDSADNHKYFIGAVFESLENQYQIHLNPDELKLNYVDWKVSPDNFFRFGGEQIFANNIILTNGNEKIIIDSKEDADKTLQVAFRELNLEYLLSMVNKEKPVEGLLHGDIFIKPDTANMTFTADLGIKGFAISEIPWGDIHFAVDRKSKDRFDVGLSIESQENNFLAQGYYLTGETPSINLNAEIQKFNLTTVEPLAGGQVKDLKGNLTGKVAVQGDVSSPKISGAFNLKDVSLFSNYTQSDFSIIDETINLNEQGIVFNSFEILDKEKNKATINGLIGTDDYKSFVFNLDVTTNHFRLLNTTEKDNELFYGRIDVDALMKVRGDLNQPVIDMKVGLSDDSYLTYVVPQGDAGVMEQQGIVKFVDKTFKDDPFMKKINPADTVTSKFTGLDLTARIELSDKEKFTVVIDPTTGDQLTVRGNTTLTLEMDPTGDLDLSGRYEIKEGTYNLSFYKFLKREFKIDEGSTMTWSGDPLNAAMDLSAIYEVETAPIDLLSAQLTGSDPQELNRYKQRLPFQVYLNIAGQLLKPEISFRLDMPLEERNYAGGNVYSRLQDINTRESDLNKQVFALLILKRFISENPFDNQGASGIEGTARTSVSKMLTEQLNRLSQNVRGVELSFDVKSYEDYSSGEAQGQTQLQLGLSKNLFNDRLVVKVAGNVGVEGQTSNSVTDYIGDLALEYKLTEDGRFRIIGFRNSNYDMIDGELTETGTGLIYVKDYNLLSELFKANAKNKN